MIPRLRRARRIAALAVVLVLCLVPHLLWKALRRDSLPGSVATEFGRGSTSKSEWALTPEDVAAVVIDLLRSPGHALYSRVEMRPSRPPRKG